MSSKARSKRTRDTVYTVKGVEFQRMRIVIEVDMPDTNFYRENFNQDALDMSTEFENKHKGAHVVLVTTEET